MLECVIFDLDGLMVDSEPLQYAAYRDAFAEFGFDLSIDHWVHWHSVEASTRRWMESQNLDIDIEMLRSRKKLIYDQMIANELTIKPGVIRLVEELAMNCRLAVASGSRRESIEACLEKFSLLEHFDHLCSATEVERSKPYPDVYLQALARLQVGPDVTLALEDSPTGLLAARRAGIACLVCADGFLPKPDADFVDFSLRVESLEEVNADVLTQILNQPNLQ